MNQVYYTFIAVVKMLILAITVYTKREVTPLILLRIIPRQKSIQLINLCTFLKEYFTNRSKEYNTRE